MNFIQVGHLLDHYIVLVDRTAAYFLAFAYGLLVVGTMYVANLPQPTPQPRAWANATARGSSS